MLILAARISMERPWISRVSSRDDLCAVACRRNGTHGPWVHGVSFSSSLATDLSKWNQKWRGNCLCGGRTAIDCLAMVKA